MGDFPLLRYSSQHNAAPRFAAPRNGSRLGDERSRQDFTAHHFATHLIAAHHIAALRHSTQRIRARADKSSRANLPLRRTLVSSQHDGPVPVLVNSMSKFSHLVSPLHTTSPRAAFQLRAALHTSDQHNTTDRWPLPVKVQGPTESQGQVIPQRAFRTWQTPPLFL